MFKKGHFIFISKGSVSNCKGNSDHLDFFRNYKNVYLIIYSNKYPEMQEYNCNSSQPCMYLHVSEHPCVPYCFTEWRISVAGCGEI